MLKVSDDDLRRLRDSLGDKRVVVFIDDLDRADPRVVPKTLLALRELLDWPSFVFVLAFDVTVIADALKEYSKSFGDSAQQFLEKIIDVPFELPNLTSGQITRLSKRVLDQCCNFIPEEERTRAAQWFPSNPRQAKLIARSLSVLRDAALRHDPGELDWHGIMLQHVLRHAYPTLAATLEQEILGAEKTISNRISRTPDEDDHVDKLDTIIQKHTNPTQPATELKWLKELAKEIIQSRELISREKIEYEMQLSTYEPCITWKEFHNLLDRWSTSPSIDVLNNELDVGARRGDTTRLSAAQEIIDAAIVYYADLLGRAAQTTTRKALEKTTNEADRTLTFIEQIWSGSAPQDLHQAAASNATTEKLFGVFKTWLHFTINPTDLPLRKREHNLIKRAAEMCHDKVGFYLKTGPTDLDDIPGTSEAETTKKYLWVSEIREAVLKDVLSQILHWFTEPGGIENVLQGSKYNSKEIWLIESSHSPLYRNETTVGELTSIFDAAIKSVEETGEDAAVQNARDYLYALLGDARRNGTWMGRDEMRRFVERCPTIVPSAWRLIIATEVQYRAKLALRELRTELGGVGVDLEKLPMPGWLMDQTAPPIASEDIKSS